MSGTVACRYFFKKKLIENVIKRCFFILFIWIHRFNIFSNKKNKKYFKKKKLNRSCALLLHMHVVLIDSVPMNNTSWWWFLSRSQIAPWERHRALQYSLKGKTSPENTCKNWISKPNGSKTGPRLVKHGRFSSPTRRLCVVEHFVKQKAWLSPNYL